jgi:glucosamine kinase
MTAERGSPASVPTFVSGPVPVPLVAGVDGGGTTTRLVLEDLHGREWARVHGGASLVTPGGEARVARLIADLLAEALGRAAGDARVAGDRAAGDAPAAVAQPSAKMVVAMVAGLAGVGEPLLREGVLGELRAMGVAPHLEVVNDTRVAFHDAFGDRSGILLVAGTGSHALARTPQGQWVRKGGWGAVAGDEGSAWALAIRGVRAAIRGAERRSPPTDLSGWLTRALQSSEPSHWVRWVQQATKAEVAALAPGVVETADQGDTTAEILVTSAVEDLVDHVAPFVELFQEEEAMVAGGMTTHPALALVGGLIAPGGVLRGRLLEALRALPIHPIAEVPDGARGGCALARHLYERGQLPG